MKLDFSRWPTVNVGNHRTSFGRWELSNQAVACDLAGSVAFPRELSVLMLASSTGQTVLDLLAHLDRRLNAPGRSRTSINMVALDIAPSVIEVAKQGHYYPFTSWCEEHVKTFYQDIPWMVTTEEGVCVDWDRLQEAGHTLRYVVFDIDAGLKHLDKDRSFDLVECLNSHHKSKEKDEENIGDVLAEDGLVYVSPFHGNQQYHRDIMLRIINGVTDLQARRFLSGLLPLAGTEVTSEQREKWFKDDPISAHTPLFERLAVQQASVLEALGRRLFEFIDSSDEEKQEVLAREPILTLLGQFSVISRGFSWHNQNALDVFRLNAEPEAKRGLYSFHDFLVRTSSVPLHPLHVLR